MLNFGARDLVLGVLGSAEFGHLLILGFGGVGTEVGFVGGRDRDFAAGYERLARGEDFVLDSVPAIP
jgi:hypothetical protein